MIISINSRRHQRYVHPSYGTDAALEHSLETLRLGCLSPLSSLYSVRIRCSTHRMPHERLLAIGFPARHVNQNRGSCEQNRFS